MEKVVNLNIYGLKINLTIDHHEISEKIEKDFDYFLEGKKYSQTLIVKTHKVSSTVGIIPSELISTKQSERTITYNDRNIRYNDFYGEAISIIDYMSNTVNLYYINDGILYETLYLLILSRSSKFMDLNGLHKVHACGINRDNNNLILMMPSKGGKTSTFLNLVEDESINIISDDSPVITTKGEILVFPIRVGLDSKQKLLKTFPYINESEIYEFDRKYYSKKYLINQGIIKNKKSSGSKNILVVGFRSTYSEPRLKKVNKIKMFKELKKHMIVGIGLPMIIEYFLENGFFDHIKNFKILYSRTISSIRLLLKSDCYYLYTSSSISKNTKKLKELI